MTREDISAIFKAEAAGTFRIGHEAVSDPGKAQGTVEAGPCPREGVTGNAPEVSGRAADSPSGTPS